MDKLSFQRIDQRIVKHMKSCVIPALRISFAVIFFWFGILKPFGPSAAEGLLSDSRVVARRFF